MNKKVKYVLSIATVILAAGLARADSINNYQVLKYLESSGTQAIDTGVKYGPTTRMRFRMQVLNGTTVSQIGVIDNFGTGGKYDRFHFQVNNGIMWVWCDRQDGGYSSASSEGGTWHDYDINLVDNKFYRDGATVLSGIYNKAYGYAGTTDEHSTIWLFGRNSNMPNVLSYATVRIGKVEIWQDGQSAERDRLLFPCRRLSDNMLGMYDLVHQEFLTNIGTGSFAAGPSGLGCVDKIPPQILADQAGACPEVVIKNAGQTRVAGSDYTVSYSDNTATGIGKVTITAIGDYADCGSVVMQYLIVPEEARLPGEYQRIAYLESTKDGKQQIDTLIHPTGNMRIEIRFQSPVAALMGMVGMIDDSPSVERFHLGCTSSNPDSLFAGLGNNYTAGMSYSTYVGNNWATMAAKTGLIGNGEPCGWFAVNATNVLALTNIGTFRADNSTFGLFGRLSKNDGLKTYAAYRVMYMEVKEGDDQILTHRFVPCRRVADGELGVYDTVARQFLYDTGREARGADVFLAGPVVGDGWRPGMVIRLY